MPRNRILALVGACLLLSGCASTHLYPPHSSAQLGTVAPAYGVGEELSPGITAIERIPVESLSTDSSAALDPQNPCRSIPPDIPTSAGFPSNPVQDTKYGCDWLDPAGFWLRIGDFPRTTDMARDVAEHLDMANGRSVDKLAHLAWLLIDGNDAIERILRSDPSSTCWISLDLGSRFTAFVVVYAIDLINKKPAAISPGDSLAKFCPAPAPSPRTFSTSSSTPSAQPAAASSPLADPPVRNHSTCPPVFAKLRVRGVVADQPRGTTMPFQQGADPTGRIGSGLPPATLVVQPDKILQLKRRFEDRREKVFAFMLDEGRTIVSVPSPGADPCSEGAVEALSQNGVAAMDALNGFVSELTNAIDALDEAARLYGLVEESNTTAFRQEPR